jgi:CubicO group peptidase (beta-lactamase class C family)
MRQRLWLVLIAMAKRLFGSFWSVALTQCTRVAITVLIGFTAASLSGCASAPVMPQSIARNDYSSVTQYLTRLIEYEMNESKVTGLSIALVDDQHIVWAQGFGYADKTNNIAATPQTVYRAGSVSKLFNATAAMQLVEQGKLDIDQPLQTYLPEFSIKSRFAQAGPITARGILTHHSGLPGDLANGMFTENPAPFTTVVGRLKELHLRLFERGRDLARPRHSEHCWLGLCRPYATNASATHGDGELFVCDAR